MYYTYALSAPMSLPFSARESLTRDFSPPRVIIFFSFFFFFFSKPAIALFEQVQALNFLLDVSKHRRRNRGGQGGHGPPTFSLHHTH